MRRADRLFQIVQYLRGGRLTTAARLAEKLEVSERTIYRDIADLIGSGVPIDGEAGVGYIMRAGFDVPPLMFTSAEIVALVAGARMARTYGGAKMAEAAEEALQKINAVLPDDLGARADAVAIHAHDLSAPSPDTRALIDRAEAACVARKRLILDYENGAGVASRRTVQPLGLWFWGKVWTLVAWCELRDDFRVFRLDRISEMHDDAPFRPDPAKTLAQFFASGAHKRAD